MEGRESDTIPRPSTSSDPTRSLETITLVGRLRRARGVWLFALLCLLVPVVLTVSLMASRIHFGGADLGLTFFRRPREPPVVLSVDASVEADVSAGDLPVVIDGSPVETVEDLYRARAQLTPGRIVDVTFLRDGERRTIPLRTFRPFLRQRFSQAVRLAAGALLMVVGLAGFVLRPGARNNWIFLSFCYSLGLLALITPPLLSFFTLGQLYCIMFVCMTQAGSAGIHLVCAFPRPTVSVIASPRRQMALYLPVALLPPVYIVGTALDRPELRNVGEALCRGWVAIATVVVVTILIKRRREVVRDGDEEASGQYRLLFWGMVVGLGVPSAVTGLVFVMGLSGWWLYDASVMLFVVFVVFVAIALIRHNALAADRFATAVVGYVVTLSIIGVSFVALVGLALPVLIDATGLGDTPEALVVLTVIAVVSINPVYRAIRVRVDAWFARGKADASAAEAALQRLVDRIQDASLGDWPRILDDAMGPLRTEGGQLWLLGDDPDTFDRQGVPKEPNGAEVSSVSRGGPLARALADGSGGVAGLAPRVLDDAAQSELWGLGLAMAAPIVAHGELVGFVGLGRRLSGTAFEPEEQRYLSSIAAQLGAALRRDGEQQRELGRYRIGRRLGIGGMAEVFSAWQMGPGGFERRVALKRLLPEAAEDADLVAMFVDEARIASGLRHPNIATVYDFDQAGGAHFLVMEYIDGTSLRRLLQSATTRGFPPPVEVVVGIGVAILDALAYAHGLVDEQGQSLEIVHRDVTTSNIMLSRRGEPKLLDFGIARSTNQEHRTETGVVRGTVPYMSPEQYAGEPMDARSDLYSLAVTLDELWHLDRPFPDGPSRRAPPPAARPSALDAALRRGYAYEREARFSSAAEFRDALVDAIAPRRPATASEIARWVDAVHNASDKSQLKMAPTVTLS